MREGWVYRTLGEVCESDLGKTLNSSKDTGELRPYLCAINILWDKIDITTLKQTRFEDSELERYTVRKGDLLICEGGDIGRAAIWDKDYSIQYQNALHRVRFTDSVAPRFCLYFFMHLKKSGILDRRYGKGITIKHLVKSSLMSIPIPVAPIENQQAIVAELDKINELIGLKKSQLSDLDSLAQSIFYEMFGDPVENEKGWEVKKLNEVSESITDGDHMPPPKSERGIPFLTISDINKETRELDFSNTFFVPQDYYDGLKEERKARTNDLLYTVTGSYGIPVIVKTDKQFCFQRHIALIRPMQKMLTTTFLCYWALSPSIKGVADRVATGIAQKTVGLNSIRQFDIVLPPLPLQQSFAAQITAIEQQNQRITASIKDLETLLASRMQYWFD
jgi:type I restriction enzyme S subunit